MTPIILLKLFLVPLLICSVTLAGRKWGPEVAGWLSAFPIVSGPILLTISLEQGAAFAAIAAEGTLLAVIAILVFSVAYAWASIRNGVAGSMILALLAYSVAVAGLQAIHPPSIVCFGVVVCALLLCPRLFPKVVVPPSQAPAKTNDLPWRMVAGAIMVLTVTFAASRIGARLSGFLAMFPIMSTVLVGFSHVHFGRAFAVTLLRGMVLGYYAFAVFCLTVSLMLPRETIAVTFVSAFICALTVQLVVKRFRAASQTVSKLKGV